MELLYDGFRLLDEHLNDESITRDDMKATIRQRGQPNLESVAAVVLETTGNVAVISSSVHTEPAEPDETEQHMASRPAIMVTCISRGCW